MSGSDGDAGDPALTASPAEIARLSDLPIGDLRARWRTVFQKVRLFRNLMFQTQAYRLQADRFGDLDAETRRILDSEMLDGRGDGLKGVMAGFRGRT